MNKRLLEQWKQSLKLDRDRTVIFHSRRKKFQAKVGDLVDLSSDNIEQRVFSYGGQWTQDQVSNGVANTFDISAICRKFPSIREVNDEEIKFTCKNKVVDGTVTLNSIGDKNFFEITKVDWGVVLIRTKSRNGKIFWRRRYKSPSWFVEEEFNDLGLVQSRQEWKNGKSNGLNFSNPNGLRTEYKNGKVLRNFRIKNLN